MKGGLFAIGFVWNNRSLLHTSYWLGILVFYPFYAMFFGARYFDSFVIKLVYLLVQIPAAYWLIYWLIPRMIYRRRYVLFLVSTFLGIYFFSTLAHLIDDFGIALILQESHPRHTLSGVLTDFFTSYYVLAATGIPLLTAGIKLTRQHYRERQEVDQLEREKAEAELQMLKARIHPRFLFNTLEYLYDLALQASDEAPEVVVKLSEMLDYMLYEANAPSVPVGKEIGLIRNYVDLERMRGYGKLRAVFTSATDDPRIEVAPLLLLSTVEQAFKYGLAEDRRMSKIQIDLKVNQQQLQLELITNRPWTARPAQSSDRRRVPPGDLDRQLNLTYPGRYKLYEAAQRDGWKTQLIINL